MLAKRAQRQRALTWQRDREAQRQRQRQQRAKAARLHHGGQWSSVRVTLGWGRGWGWGCGTDAATRRRRNLLTQTSEDSPSRRRPASGAPAAGCDPNKFIACHARQRSRWVACGQGHRGGEKKAAESELLLPTVSASF